VNRVKHKVSTFFLFFLVFTLSVFASWEYLNKDDFITYYGFWASQIPISSNDKSISLPTQPPLVFDLDFDGIDDIIVLDGNEIKIFQNKTMDLVDSITLYGNPPYSNMIIQTNFSHLYPTEPVIMLISEQQNNAIWNRVVLNSTHGLEQGYSNMSAWTNVNWTNGEILLGCRADTGFSPSCMAFMISHNSSSEGTPVVTGLAFNRTTYGNVTTYDWLNYTKCFPTYRTGQWENWDGVGDTEFIFDYVTAGRGAGGNEYLTIMYTNLSHYSSVSAGSMIDGNCSTADPTAWYCEDAEDGNPVGYASNTYQYAISGYNNTYAFNSSVEGNTYAMPAGMNITNYLFEATMKWSGYVNTMLFGLVSGQTWNMPKIFPARANCNGTAWCYHTPAGYVTGATNADTDIHSWRINCSGLLPLKCDIFIDGTKDATFNCSWAGADCTKGEWNLGLNQTYDNMCGVNGAFADHCIYNGSVGAGVSNDYFYPQALYIKNTTISSNPISATIALGGVTTCWDYPIDPKAGNAGKVITNALVMDINNSPTNLEVVVGLANYDFNQDPDFDLYSWDKEFNLINSYVLVGDTGQASNLFPLVAKSTHGTDASYTDFCMFGWGRNVLGSGNNRIGLLCGSEWNGSQANYYSGINLGEYHNLSTAYRDYSGVTYSTSLYGTNTTNGYNLGEIMTSYGAFTLYEGGMELHKGFDMTTAGLKNKSAILPYRFQGESYDDIVQLSALMATYVDDDFINTGAEIVNWSINPCIFNDGQWQTWKANTTINVSIQVRDTNSLGTLDTIGARFIMYNDSGYIIQNSSWTSNVTGGTSGNWFNITLGYEGDPFIANQTITNGTIIFLGRDSYNQTIVFENATFSVGASGVINGECITYMGFNDTLSGAIPPSATTYENNTMTGYGEDVSGWTGLPLNVLWFLLMAFLTAVIWIEGSKHEPVISIGAIILVDIVLLFTGFKFGIISGGFIAFVIFICVIIGAFMFRKKLMGVED